MQIVLLFLSIIFFTSVGHAQLDWYTNPLNPNGFPVSSRDQQNLIRLNSDLETVNLVHLLPSRYYVLKAEENPQLQSIVDELLLKILSTSTGSKICQLLTAGDPKLIQQVLGLSSSASLRSQALCPRTDNTLPAPKNHRQRYIFVFSPDNNSKVDSWTNTLNVTTIFVSLGDLNNLPFILSMLAHEIAMKADTKEGLGIFGNLSNEKFGSRTCEITTAIRNPIIKYSFNTIRAFTLERRILQELHLPVENKSERSCERQLLEVLPKLIQLSVVFPLEFPIARFSQAEACGSESQIPDLSLNQILEILNREKVKTESDEISLCNYLLIPEIGVRQSSLSSGGPRPRIGSGSGVNRDKEISPENLDSEMRSKQKEISGDIARQGKINPALGNTLEKLKTEIKLGAKR